VLLQYFPLSIGYSAGSSGLNPNWSHH